MADVSGLAALDPLIGLLSLLVLNDAEQRETDRPALDTTQGRAG